MLKTDIINRAKRNKEIKLSARICLCCEHCRPAKSDFLAMIESKSCNDFLYCNLENSYYGNYYYGNVDYKNIGYIDNDGNKFIDGKNPPLKCPYYLEHIFHNEARKEIRSKLSKTEKMLEVLKNRHKDYNPEKEYNA